MAIATIEPSTVKYYFIQSKLNDLVLDIDGYNSGRAGRLNMYSQKDMADADNQLWYFVEAGNGQYAIHSKLNNFALTSISVEGDPRFMTYPADGTTYQRWSLEFKGTEAFITAAAYGLVVNINRGKTDRGAMVGIYEKNGEDHQWWRFIPA